MRQRRRAGRHSAQRGLRGAVRLALVAECGPIRSLPRMVQPEVNRDTYRALAGAANNLNQLTRLAHAGNTVCADAVLREVLATVRQVQRELYGAAHDSEAG